MRIQKTFTIVPPPGPVARTPVENRPMTSKQVRKAYQAANRVPRVSRAEQLRQERAEQERIRKEFEKEKAAAKAKLLREKKRAKEQAEKEEKKKKGLPLVNVRPSQDTIAWFVRGNGSGNKRDCKGKDVETTDMAKASALPAVEELDEDEEEDDDFPSLKRFCNEEPPKEKDDEEAEAEEEEEETASLLEEPCTKLDAAAPEKSELTAEEDFLEGFEIMSDEEISTLSFNQKTAKKDIGITEECIEPQSPTGAIPEERDESRLHETTLHEPNPIISVKNPEPIALEEFDLIFDDEDDLELEMLALDVVMTSQQHATMTPLEKPSLQQSQRPARTATDYEVDLGLAAVIPKKTTQATGPAKHDQTALMPPPPVPAALRPSHATISPIAEKFQAPPLSTQQILFNMDDFFPTSSQQAAELEEEETSFISQPSKSGLVAEARAPSPAPGKDSLPAGTLSSSPEPPKPFFTSSGSNERLAVALLRSRRTAEREEEQRRRALQLEAIELQEAKKKEAAHIAREKRLAESKMKAKTSNVAASKTGPYEKGQDPRQTKPVTAAAPQFSTRKGLVWNSNCIPGRTTIQRAPLVETNAQVALPNIKLPPTAETNKKIMAHGTSRPPSSHPSLNTNKPPPLEAKHGRSSPKHSKTPTKVSSKENITSPGFSEPKHLMASQESEFGGSWMDELATELSL
ncbi:hypothetical protein TARUN_2832 [Trichoderma arundinaceum]|uniref:Uncharacterized protein n=1 Tax=Trichoderma arundinaceum TaxID=490622 RepID=A0A395NU86_TRIAR|nr:hypothetical protein TARUN_2832 [Trichoderma arundinaceum]